VYIDSPGGSYLTHCGLPGLAPPQVSVLCDPEPRECFGNGCFLEEGRSGVILLTHFLITATEDSVYHCGDSPSGLGGRGSTEAAEQSKVPENSSC
jgi:hypothetical protein